MLLVTHSRHVHSQAAPRGPFSRAKLESSREAQIDHSGVNPTVCRSPETVLRVIVSIRSNSSETTMLRRETAAFARANFHVLTSLRRGACTRCAPLRRLRDDNERPVCPSREVSAIRTP
jgi:hypothetical protein